MAICEQWEKERLRAVKPPMRATKRQFKPNLQKISVYENGRMVRKTCTRCIRTLVKSLVG